MPAHSLKRSKDFPLSGEREGGCFRDHLGTITHLKTGSTVTEYSFDAWGRRRDKDDWTYTLTSEPAIFADRGFTGHEYLEDFKLYNMNGRLYDPVVGRFLSPDPYVQDPGFTQSLNRYSYCLNNPLKFTDPTGEKWNWNWLNPLYHFENFMQWVNDKTPQLRQNMTNAGIPSFGIGTSVNFAGNVNINGSIYGQQVFNTANIDRSDAVSKVEKEIARVNNRYGNEWRAADGLGTTNNWLTGAGYFSGGIGAIQIGMLDYRSSLPIMSRIGTFSRFSSTYSKLGAISRVTGEAGNWLGGPLTIALDYNLMQTGKISSSRFAYRTTGTLSSITGGTLIGYSFGGPYGAAGGAFIGLGFAAGENIYDGVTYIWEETLRQITNFNRAIGSGWVPGR